ncbi:hypothetical protein D3C75_631180 [compost metagenome]
MHANQRIDQVGAGADIQNRGLSGHGAVVAFRQQISEMVNVICAPRYRWAEIAFRDIPLRDAVKMGKQRFVQRLHGLRIGKVHRRLAGRCLGDKFAQRRTALA